MQFLYVKHCKFILYSKHSFWRNQKWERSILTGSRKPDLTHLAEKLKLTSAEINLSRKAEINR